MAVHGLRRPTIALLLALLLSSFNATSKSDRCFGWIKPPALKPVQGWYQESRLVSPEGGAPMRGTHPPRPPKFHMEGRLSSSLASQEMERPQIEAGEELSYLSLALRDKKALSRNTVEGVIETASKQAQRGALEAEELSSTMKLIASFRKDLPSLKTHLGVISDTLLGRANDLQATGTTEALWAVAEMAQEAPMLQALLPVLVFRLAKTARQLTSEETMSSLFSFTMLRSNLRDLKLNLAPLTAYLANQLRDVDLQGRSLQDLVDFFYSLALTRTLPSELHQALVSKLGAELTSRGHQLTTHNTYTLLYSVAMMQETTAHESSLKLLPVLLESFERVSADMKSEQLAGCLWALGWLDPGGARSIGHLQRVRAEIGVALGELKMRDLSLALWGMAAMDFRDQDLLAIATEQFLAIQGRVKAPILAKSLTRVVWAFAKLDYHNKMFKLAVEDRLQPQKYVIRFLQPDQLHALLWSFDRLMPGERWQKTRKDIEFKVMAYIKMRYRHGFGSKVDEFGDERIRKITIGRIEPYVEIDPETPKPQRNQVMLKKAKELGEAGPDVPNVRRKMSGRPRWSVTQWVDTRKRFVTYAQQKLGEESTKRLQASRDLALPAAPQENLEEHVEARAE